MADNVTANAGAGGAVFATDDIGSVHYPRSKVVWGPDGTANDTAAASGKALPVQGEAAHDAATTGNPVLVGAEFDDTLPDSVDEGDVGRLRISARRELYVQLRDAAGNERGAVVDASGQVGVTVGNTVTVASHAVTNAGTFAVQVDGNALTSLQLIDDVVYADDTAFTPATSKVVAIGAQADETATDSVDEGDIGALRMTLDRLLLVQNRGHGKTIISTGGSASTSGNNTLVSADASNKIKVKAFSLTTTSTTAMTCIFQSGAGGTELWRVIIQAASGTSAGANLSVAAPDWLFETASNTLLNLNLSSANAVHWSVSYFKEA